MMGSSGFLHYDSAPTPPDGGNGKTGDSETALLGAWEWEVSKDECTWSSGMRALLGLPKAPFTGPLSGLLKLIEVGDRGRVYEELQRCIYHCTSCHFGFTVVWPDGTEHEVAVAADVLC